MRGTFVDQSGLFSYIAPEARVPVTHPLRKIREIVRDVLGELTRSLGRLYASEGRPSIPPEQLLSALLLQVFYGIRSERQLMEQLDYNLLYRWFVGLSPDDPIWDPTTFTKNRDRLQTGAVFAKFMSKLLNHPEVKPLLSDEHFSVDGTLIEAWASHKSFRPKDGSGDDDGGADFHGQQRKNDTHASTCEALIGFVCPHRDAFEFLELAEEILDQVPPLVEFGVQPQRQCPPWVLRDHDLCAALVEVGNDGIAVEGLVGDQSAEGDSVDQRSDADRIETVAGQQDEADQIAERVGQREYFGRHAALGAADRLVLRPPFAP